MSDQNQNPDSEEAVNTKEPIRITVAKLKLELESGLSRKELAKKFGTNEKQISNIVAVAGLAFSRARPAIILVDDEGNVLGTSLQTTPVKAVTTPAAPAASVVESPVVAPALAEPVVPVVLEEKAVPKIAAAPAEIPVDLPKPKAPAQQPVMASAFVQPTGNLNTLSDPFGDAQVRVRKPLREF